VNPVQAIWRHEKTLKYQVFGLCPSSNVFSKT
jgi:hypothetical protein